MAINKEGTGYTIGFSAVMVVVVGTILAVLAMALKPAQQENVKQEKMQNILSSVGIDTTREAAAGMFGDYIKQRLVLDPQGNVIGTSEGAIDPKDENDGFNVDVKKQYRSNKAKAIADKDMKYPLFVCDKAGETFYIIPMVGTGLWGPIWGFMSVEDDMTTVYGATFDHKTETPGLGAEINQTSFESQFVGKAIFDDAGTFAPIVVVKGGAKEGDKHGVDAITGGTITSDGVTEMLERSLGVYKNYFQNNKN